MNLIGQFFWLVQRENMLYNRERGRGCSAKSVQSVKIWITNKDNIADSYSTHPPLY